MALDRLPSLPRQPVFVEAPHWIMGTHLPQENTREQLWRSVFLYVACYILWLGLSALGLGLLILLRGNLIDLAFWLATNPWVPRAIDRFGIFLLGLLWLGGVIGLEGYLRNGVAKGRLWVRTGRVLAILVIVGSLSYGLQMLDKGIGD
jgi:hypothetical protein